MRKRALRGEEPAFTLLELLIVVAIVVILAGLLMAAFSKVQGQAQQVESTSRLKSIGSACLLFVADNNGKLPPSTSSSQNLSGTISGRWPFHLQPYLGEDPTQVSYAKSKVFRCPTQDALMQGPSTARGIYGYNKFFMQTIAALNWSRLSQIDNPSQLPLFASASGEGATPGSIGPGGLHMETTGPHPAAIRYGYSGPTSLAGPAPNLDGTTLYLMADMHVEAVRGWPWTSNSSSFHPKRDTSILPP